MTARTTALLAAAALTAAGALTAVPIQGAQGAAGAAGPHERGLGAKRATSIGFGGAVSTVDPSATQVGLRVLKQGGNAVDAAIATAGALGVTEPYSSGIGGGGYFVFYNAAKGKVQTIDGRETAPAAMPSDAFIDKSTGKAYTFTPDLVTSGVSVGVPGTPATWDKAMKRWGTWTLGDVLEPAIKLATDGFKVDSTFAKQTEENKVRFAAFPATSAIYLPGGAAPAVGSVLKNEDLAATYKLLADKGVKAFYDGKLAAQIAGATRHPAKSATTTLPVPPGSMTVADLHNYRVVNRKPTAVGYRGYDVYGMAPSSSGGTTVGEALNIMERYDLGAMADPLALHHYLEASALAFADRGAYVGDPRFVPVPQADLLGDTFAAERACKISETTALVKPVAAGNPASYDGSCATPTAGNAKADNDTENISTTNMTVTDRWGNIVEYTLTIEQTGGSGMVVPGRGFILNNELTDFSTVYSASDPNRIQPGKRPRSSMSPTIVLKDGEPFLALGSPGGSTIITTVLQMIFNRIDRGMTIQDAIAAPRAAQRNTASVTAEQSFIDAYGPLLAPFGHKFAAAGAPGTSAAEIGAATAVEFGKDGLLTAVAEPTRRGGGATGVVVPK
jgi:gamma-glutamyltranspeptidase / glutathione hydrolase